MEDFAQIACEDLPAWEGQNPDIRVHWDAAAQAVVKAVAGGGG